MGLPTVIGRGPKARRRLGAERPASMGLPTVIGRGGVEDGGQRGGGLDASMGLPTVIGRGVGSYAAVDLTEETLQWGCRR